MLTDKDIAEAKRALKELSDEAQGNGNSEGWIAAQERPILAVIAAHEAKAVPSRADQLLRKYIECLVTNDPDGASDATKSMVDYVFNCPPATAHEAKAAPAVLRGFATLNEWFLSLPEQRQAQLRDDKWMLAGAAFEAGQALAPAVPMSESQRADMICAVAAICTGTSSRTVAATAIEWVERYYGITTPAAPSQEPVTLTDEWPFMTPHEVELRLGRQEVVLRFVTESETQQTCDAIIAALREKEARK